MIPPADNAPLHERIRSEIEAQVMSGAWPPGQRIPYEHELMARYDCSRMTINKALATLVERGLIERRKRAGSFVLPPRSHRAIFELPDLRTQIEAEGKAYEFALTRRILRDADAQDRALLDIAGGEVLALQCVHHGDGIPRWLEQRRINLRLVPEARTVAFDREPPDSWLLAHIPWSDARHRISAIGADAGIAAALEVSPGTPCMLVERWTWRVAEKITYARLIHPGAGFAIEAHLRP